MRYEHFLFTRNQRRDFTAFVRPVDTSNKDISAIARAFNYVNDITPLTPEAPALYCFPLGAYLYLLRHYNSGRKHAGREIPVIEGIAIRRELESELRDHLPDLVARQAETLNVSAQVGDIDALEINQSREHIWALEPGDEQEAEGAEPDGTDANERAEANSLLDEFIRRYPAEWLALPVTNDSRAFLIEALSDQRLPILHFAFGSNADVTAELAQTGIAFDLAACFNIAEPVFRRRSSVKAVTVPEVLSKQPQPDKATFEPDIIAPEPQEQRATASDGATPAVEPLQRTSEPIYEHRQSRRKRRRGLLRALVDLLLRRSRSA